ncbi:type II toxin-antitoxin system Phd/YefM family antitoxin [Nonomuraea sp. M3C6]|uniref:Antitoxin n=1 Tax=Nonomuraea marmarensis TaxID=3351344 RepID=A0ABW7A6L1_9ACTN
MSITAGEARRRLLQLIEEVNNDRTAVEIVSKSGNAYLVAAEEYEALQETAHLLRSPANARRLIASYREAVEGRYERHEVLDDEAARRRPQSPGLPALS